MCLKRIHFKADKSHHKSLCYEEGLAFDSALLANSDCTYSPSFAEGARGWVNLQWKEFKLGDLFEKLEYKKLDLKKSNLPKEPNKHCNLPAITCATQNNGISCYVPKDNATIFKNCISVAANGDAPAFYQPHDFTILQDAYVLKFKGRNLEYPHYLYLVTLLQKILTKYDWTNKSGWEKVKLENIKLPTQEGKIAFDFMESFIKELELERIKELEAYLQATGLNNYELTDKEKQTLDIFGNANSVHFYPPQNTPPQTPRLRGGAFSASTSFAHEYSKNSPFLTNEQSSYPPSRSTSGVRGWVNLQWQEFRIGDLFSNIQQGARLKQADHIKGNLAFVMSGTENTGISGFIGNENARKFKANALTIDIFGNVFYRNYDFGASDDVGVFWNDKNPIKEKAMLFLCAVIAKSLRGRFDFGRKLRASQSNDIKIQLPTDKNGQIAFEFMESFISAVQKEVIKSVNLWSEKRIQAAKKSIL